MLQICKLCRILSKNDTSNDTYFFFKGAVHVSLSKQKYNKDFRIALRRNNI